MIYEDVIKDFAERTKKNLVAIDKLRADGSEVYETTQLINSCLGLLIFPQQQYINGIPETPLQDLESQGWPIPRVTGKFRQVDHLKDLIRYLRNAIAHFNISFIGDGHNQIRVLRVWNTSRGSKTWEAELSIDDLRGITDRFSDMLINYKNPMNHFKQTDGRRDSEHRD